MSARARWAPTGPARLVLAAVRIWVGGLVGLPLLALVLAVGWRPLEVMADFARYGGFDALGRSLWLALAGVVLGAVSGIAGGIVLSRQRFWGRAALDAMVDLPLAVSPVVVGLAYIVMVGRGGWLEPLTSAVGLQILFAWPGLVIATAFVTLPFFVREVALVLDEVGTTEDDAARTLGASELQVFWWVTLPQLRGALRVATLLTVARSLGEFGAVLVLGGAIDGRTQTATTFVHTMMEERHDAAAYGMSLVLAALTILLVQALPGSARARQQESP